MLVEFLVTLILDDVSIPYYHYIPTEHGSNCYTMTSAAALNDFKAFAMRSPLILSVVSFLVVTAFIRYLLNRPRRLNLPVVGSPNSKNWPKDMVQGTMKVMIRLMLFSTIRFCGHGANVTSNSIQIHLSLCQHHLQL
jgi:hypothetical protein